MNIMVVNLGLKSIRGIVFNETGAKLACYSEPIHTFVQEDLVEQDPNERWQKTQEVVIKAIQAVPERDQIMLLTVTASASCLVCVNEKGEPLMNAIMVSDSRPKRHAELLENIYEFQKVKTETGMMATPDLMLPKIMWLKESRPHVFRDTYKFLTPADYLIYKITNEYVVDTNNATKYHLDVSGKKWPTELLDVLGIDHNKFPNVADPGTEISNIKKNIADEWGLPRSARVFLATYDALCAVVGAGVCEPGEGCDNSGTVTSLRVVTDKRIQHAPKGVFFSPYFGTTYWLAGGSNNLGGGLIEWVKQLLFKNDETAYDVMESEIADVKICSDGLIFLPYLLGERAPVWNPLARGVFFGLSRQHTQKHMLRAVFESTGFSMLHIAETLRNLNISIESVVASGGLSRINSICQIKADMLGVPVNIVDEFETTSLGAAILTVVGSGYFSTTKDATTALVRKCKQFEPNKNNQEAYLDYFELYKKIYANLKDLFTEREALRLKYYLKREVAPGENL